MRGLRVICYEAYKRCGGCTRSHARAFPVSLSKKPLCPVPEAPPKTSFCSLSRLLVHCQTWRLTGYWLGRPRQDYISGNVVLGSINMQNIRFLPTCDRFWFRWEKPREKLPQCWAHAIIKHHMPFTCSHVIVCMTRWHVFGNRTCSAF